MDIPFFMQDPKWTKVRCTSVGSLPCVCLWMCLCFALRTSDCVAFILPLFGFRSWNRLHLWCCVKHRNTVPSTNFASPPPPIKICGEAGDFLTPRPIWPVQFSSCDWLRSLGHLSPSSCQCVRDEMAVLLQADSEHIQFTKKSSYCPDVGKLNPVI